MDRTETMEQGTANGEPRETLRETPRAAAPRPRAAYTRIAPGAMRAMGALEAYVRASGLEESLLELVRIRASVMNGCAYCVDMHTKDARLAGETEQRLYAVPVWKETPFFSPRERAALAWTEAVTDISRGGVPDDVYDAAVREFGEEQLVRLTMAIVAINGWNRLAVSFRSPVGTYVAGSSARTYAQATAAAQPPS